MNCQYCHTNHRKFYCTNCIKEKLQKHSEDIGSLIQEKDGAVAEASLFLEKATIIQTLLAEKNKRIRNIDSIRENQSSLTVECSKKAQRIKELKLKIAAKNKLLEESSKRKAIKLQQQQQQLDTNTALKAWQRTHKMTVGTRRILVKEISSLFELKPGVIEEQLIEPPPITPTTTAMMHNKEDLPAFSFAGVGNQSKMIVKEDLYICGVTLPTRLIDVSKYPKEELNAPISLVIHMLGLIVRYLGIKLPFEIIRRGIRPYIRTPNKQHVRKFPLFLEEDDKNFKKFIHGMAMLNYNIAYICHTQGIKIPVNQVADTLQGLMAICRAPGLGIQSHALYYQHIRDLECPIEYDQVLRATTLRYRCSSSLERSQILHHQSPNNSTNTPALTTTTNNELHDDFFKIRRASSSHSAATVTKDEDDEEEEEEEEYGLYVDSDEEEEDDYDHYNTNKKTKKRQQDMTASVTAEKEEEQCNDSSINNETWSLVEVAPFLGKNAGRAAHNGNEGESIFQIGAASIMPGVMNMMESLSGNSNQTGLYHHSRGTAAGVGENTTITQSPINDRYWLPRRKNY